MADPLDLLAGDAGLDVTQPVAGADLLADPNAPGPFARGVKSGVAGVKGSLYGMGALAARGATAVLPAAAAPVAAGLEQAALENVAAQNEIASQGAMSFEDVVADPSRAGEYFKFLLGNAVPSLAAMATGGGIGAGIGALATRGSAAALTAQALGAVAPAVRTGALVGAVAPDFALEAGSIYPEALKTGVENPALRSVAGGAAAAALDFIPLLAAEKYLKPIGKGGIGALVKGAFKGSPVGAALEGTQEAGQAVVERAAAGHSLTDPAAVSDYINSFAGGAAPGAVFGAGIGARRQAAAPVADPAPIAADPATVVPDLGTNVPDLGTPAPASITPEALHADLTAKHAAATTQETDLTSLLGTLQQAQAEGEAKVAALAAEAKLDPGNRRIKSEILAEKKDMAAQVKEVKAKIEEVGGQLNAARTTIGALTPQLEAARQALPTTGPDAVYGNQYSAQATADSLTAETGTSHVVEPHPTAPEKFMITPRDPVVPDLVAPEIPPRAAPVVSDVIADPNLPPPTPAEQTDRAVKGVHALFREQGMPLTTTEESLATPPQTPREVALAKVEQRQPRESVPQASPAQMQAIEANAMSIIEPLANTMAEAKTKTPEAQAKVAAKLAKAMRGVVQEAAKQGSIEAAQQYVTDKLPNALKGHGVTADAADMAKAVNAGVGLARTLYSKGAMSNVKVGKAFSSLVSTLGRDDVSEMLSAWNDADLSTDGTGITTYPGRDGRYSAGELGGKVKLGKGEFLSWLHSGTPLNPVVFDVTDEWKAKVEAARAATGLAQESRAALTQDEFDTLPEPAQFAAVDAYNRVMRAKGTALRQRMMQLIGDRPELKIKTFSATPDSPIGSYTRVGPLRAVVAMALNAKEGLSVADHEGYHFAEDWLLTPGERRVAANALKAGKPLYNQLVAKLHQYDRENGTSLTDEVTAIPAEARAYAFEFWRRGEFKADGALAKAWAKLKQFFERVANAVNGLGFQSIEDVFVALDRGQMAEREMVAPENSASRNSMGADYLQSPAFKKWFGDSKVVDAAGKPLVVYHGTATPDITEFRRTRTGEFGPAIYTTADAEEAASYGAGAGSRSIGQAPVNVMPVFVSLQNPWTDGVDAFWKRFNRETDGDKEAVQRAIDAGFDGVIATRQDYIGKTLTHYVAFSPTQIKSAIGNTGAFDPSNPDIRFSTSGAQGWYRSALTEAVAGIQSRQATAQGWKDQIKGLIAGGKAKQVELDAVGLNEWLDLQAGLPAFESGFAVIEEMKNDAGVWEQVDDLGMYSRTKTEAERAMAGLGAARGDGTGTPSRYSIKALPKVDMGKRDPKITKDQVMAFLGENGVQVRETVLGESDAAVEAGRARAEADGNNWDELSVTNQNRYIRAAGGESIAARPEGTPKFASYQLPGGENYRELLLTLPSTGGYEVVAHPEGTGFAIRKPDGGYVTQQPGTRNPGDASLWETEADAKRYGIPAHDTTNFRSSHFDQPNILAHIRFNERTDAAGKRVLFIEEIQSDWAQKGRRVGFTDENAIKEAKAKAQAMRGEWEDANTKLDAAKVEVRKYAKAALAKMGLDSYQQIITAGAKRAELTLRFRDLQKEPAYARAIREEDRLNTIAGDLATRMGEYERGHGQDNTVPNAPFVSTNKFAVFKDGKEVTRTDKDGKEHQERYSSMKDAEAAAVKKGGEARDIGMQEDTQAWTALALKRMIRYAAENGFDSIAWTTGEQQAARYDLSKQIKEIDYIKRGDKYEIAFTDNNGGGHNPGTFTATELPDVVGKEVAQKIVDGEGKQYRGRESRTLEGLDLKVGGEGMKGYYDKIVVGVANDILKKLGGGKVGEISVGLNTPTTTPGMTRVVRDDDGTYAVEVRKFDEGGESFWEPAAYGLTKEDAEARRLFGGQVPAMQQPGFTITPRLAEAAANGLPLFSKAAVEKSNRMAAGELEAMQVGEQYAHLIENANLSNDLFTRAFGVVKEDIVGGLGRWWTNTMSTPNYISAASAGFKNVYQAFNTYSRYRKILAEQLVRERLPGWYQASDADRKAAFDVMLKRTVGKFSTNSLELADLLRPLTPQQRTLYDQATGMIAGVLQRQFESQKVERRRQLTTPGEYEKWLAHRQEQMASLLDTGYVPLRRYGDYSVSVYMEAPDGSRVQAGLEFFASPSAAKAASIAYAREIERSGVALKVELGRRSKNERDTGVSLEQFLGTLRRQGVDISQAERERLVVAMTNADSLVRTQMMRREGLAGYSTDGMRVLHEFGVNTTSEIAYARFAPVLDAALDGAEVTADVNSVTSEPIIQIGEAFGRREDGVENNLWKRDGPMSGFYKDRANAMADTTLSPDRQSEWATKLRTAGVMYFIGGSISGAAVNTLSIPMVLVPRLSLHTDYLSASMTSLKAWKDSWQHYNILRDMDRMKNPDAETAAKLDAAGITKEMRASIVAAADHIFDTEIHQMLGISQGSLYSKSRNVQRAAEAWMAPFRVAEQTNRLASFIAAYKVATTGDGVRQADGTFKRLSGQELFRFASETVDATQNNYNVNNRPGIMNNPVGALMFQFKSFPLFMIEAAALMYKQSPKSAVYMLLGLVAMSGVQGLPFAEEILNLVDVISQRLFGSPFNSRRAMRNAIKTASDAIGAADLSDAVMRGVVNEITGVNVATRVSGGLLPGTRIGAADATEGRVLSEIAGAPFSMVQDAMSNVGGFVSGIATGDWQKAADAMRAGGPIAARNAIKGAEQLSQGYASDSKGRKVADVSTVDGLLQLTGLSSAAVQKMNDMQSIIIQTKAFHTQVNQDMQNRLVKAYRDGDQERIRETLDFAAKWNEQNPAMPILPNPSALRRQIALAGMPLSRREQVMLGRRLGGAFADVTDQMAE